MKLRLFAIVMLAFAAGPAPVLAQATNGSGRSQEEVAALGGLRLSEAVALEPAVSVDPATGRPRVVVSPTRIPPSIDGRLDDSVWETAAHITEFIQSQPVEGAPASEATDVWIAYDTGNLYIAVHAHYSNPGLIRANRADRDQLGGDDTISFFFDTFLDQQRAYVFTINGYGVQGDSLMGGGGGFGGGGRGGGGGGGGRGGGRGFGGGGFGGPGDSSWDALFSSAGRLVEDGWIAELAIPFKSLRYPQEAGRGQGELLGHRWGFQIQRDIDSKNERVHWSPMSRSVSGFLRQMGRLEGLTDLSTSRNLEFLPTFTAISAGRLDETTGRFETIDTNPEAGLNVKYGITSNVTADFTVNPDFSQIESDVQQIEVNQRFPIFYPERRPFFLEGQEIFSVPGPVTMIHTRTIVDPAYGGKITGKVGKTTLGVMFANDEAPGRTGDASDPAFGQSANVFMGRVRYDVFSESFIGAIVTNREFMNTYSRLGGVDGNFRFGENFRSNFRLIATDRLRDTGERKTGPLYDFSFRREGRNLGYSLIHYRIDPEFGTDVGFVRRVDVQETRADISYRWWPESWIQNWGPQFDYSRNYDFDGVLQDEDYGANLRMQFANNINVSTGVNRTMERFRDVDFYFTRVSFGGGINASRRISFFGFYNGGNQIRYVENPFLGGGRSFNMNMTLRPFSRLQSRLGLSTSRLIDLRDDSEIFDIKILRSETTYQFTDRLVLRNISEHNTFDKTTAVNLLVTYRVNSGTVFYVGYDDHYQAGNKINTLIFPTSRYQQTGRAIFTKLQYLFRY